MMDALGGYRAPGKVHGLTLPSLKGVGFSVRRSLPTRGTGVLQSFRTQGIQSPRPPFWRSKRPAQLGGTEASGSCHDVVVTTDGVPFPRERPQNTGFGLKSTFRTVILLLMGRPPPCSASTGVV